MQELDSILTINTTPQLAGRQLVAHLIPVESTAGTGHRGLDSIQSHVAGVHLGLCQQGKQMKSVTLGGQQCST